MMSSDVITSTGSKPSLLQAVEKRGRHSASELWGWFGKEFWIATRIDLALLEGELRSVLAAFDEDPVGLKQFAAPWILEFRAERNAMIAELC